MDYQITIQKHIERSRWEHAPLDKFGYHNKDLNSEELIDEWYFQETPMEIEDWLIESKVV